MFNGMMDPELIKLAQQQMSRMSAADFAKIQEQIMANPELMRMATENMNNMRPEDLRQAAQQLNHTRPEDMAEIGEKIAKATPEEIAAMRARLDAQSTYELNAAQMLKKQGNELHSQGKYSEAMQKYLLAKKNLNGVHSSKGRTLSMACSLNLMSCYLKTRQYDECIKEGSEVLAYDAKNVKALYRRGQAYKELGQFQDAVSDLSNAHEAAPDDETIADVLRDTETRLAKEGGYRAPGKLVIEEITEEVGAVPSGNNKNFSGEHSATQKQRTDFPQSESRANGGGMTSSTESLQNLKADPEAIRSFQNFISNTNPETLAAMSGGKTGEISPDMFKAASNMVGKMSSEELQRMLELASSFHGENTFSIGGSSEANLNSFKPGSMPPNVTPDMLKTASDMMSKMSPEDLQKMFEMRSSLKTRDTDPVSTAVNTRVPNLDNSLNLFESRESSAVNGNNAVDETSSSRSSFSNSRSGSQPNFQPSTADLQQMRNQLNDPAMKEMLSSMIKNMSPEMMANMSQQFGMNISQEDAAKVQQAMSSLSPEDLDRMMRWADKMQRGVEGAKKAKSWLLGKPGMILAICMLILAILLHRLGYIGN